MTILTATLAIVCCSACSDRKPEDVSADIASLSDPHFNPADDRDQKWIEAFCDSMIIGHNCPGPYSADEGKFYRRLEAARALGDMGEPAVRAIPALIDDGLDDHRNAPFPGMEYYTRDGDRTIYYPYISDYAEASLRKLIPVANGFGLDYASEELLSAETPLSRKEVLASILPAYGPQAVPILTKLLYSGDAKDDKVWPVQMASLAALQDFGEQSVNTFIDVLRRHPRKELRERAALALAEGDPTCGLRKSFPWGIEHTNIGNERLWDWREKNTARLNPTKSSCEQLRLRATRDHVTGFPSAVPALIDALHDPNDEVRLYAAYALAEIGDLRAVEPLAVSLMDERNRHPRPPEWDTYHASIRPSWFEQAYSVVARGDVLALHMINDPLVREQCFNPESAGGLFGSLENESASLPCIPPNSR